MIQLSIAAVFFKSAAGAGVSLTTVGPQRPQGPRR